MIYREILEYDTKTGSFIDITPEVREVLARSKINEGICNLFIPGTTAGLMMNEPDLMLMADFKKFLSIIDDKKMYNHPGNSFSHLRANLLGFDKNIPISNNQLILGQWQHILLWEFDIKKRSRQVIVTIIGE
jgi:secondary thiamine-phosphate synthase enzyme